VEALGERGNAPRLEGVAGGGEQETPNNAPPPEEVAGGAGEEDVADRPDKAQAPEAAKVG
jgi:hypothetical protein